jgi:hypothetical protein
VTLDLMDKQSLLPVLMSHCPLEAHAPGIRRRNTSELDRVAATSMANVRAQMPQTTATSRGSSVQGSGAHLGRKTRIQLSFLA